MVRAGARRSVDPFYTLYFFFTERKKENTEIQNLAQVQRSPPRNRECIPKRTSRDLGKFLDFWIGAVTASLPYHGTWTNFPQLGKGSFTASRQRRRARGKISRPPARLQQDEVRAFPPALFLAAAPTLGFAAPAATLAVAFLRMCSRDARPRLTNRFAFYFKKYSVPSTSYFDGSVSVAQHSSQFLFIRN